ncbi:hypothetical protein WJX73_008519 [Symbiochloris irregularis]|uniref:N-alpha-acetyltransferase 60 n=1 Tax=Symbiochloris irregularis TaxID=706552 RepID=A0AAW1PIE4_9CHLO
MTRRGAGPDFQTSFQSVLRPHDTAFEGVPEIQVHRPSDRASHLVLPLSSLRDEVFYRPVCAGDYSALKAAHLKAFPIDYDEAFYERAIAQDSGISSWAAVQKDRQSGQEELIGFITAQYLRLHECDPTDRAAMGLGSTLVNGQEVVYILTLGVAEAARRRGTAGQLLRLVLAAAEARGCRACFLHVICYNHAAISFYLAHSFDQLAELRDFYCIVSGRQPDPDRAQYNAYLCARHLREEGDLSAMAYISSALFPFRSLMDSWGQASGQQLAGIVAASS